jgi:hypothetical protein
MPLHFHSTRTVKPFVAHSSNVNCLALGRKSAGVLVTGGEDALINVWRLGRPSALLNLTGHASPITCVDFDHREEMVTGGSFGGSLKVFDLSAHGKVVRTYQGHHTAVTSIDHHPYGGHVVSGSTDSSVRLWDLRRKNCRSTFKGHAGALTCVRFSPDGSQVASGSDDGRIKIWDLTAGKLLQEFQHKGVRSIEYHPNDFLMCSVGKDRCIKMWDVDRMELVETSTKQQSNARCIRFDRHGEGLLTATDSSLKSWKWEPMRIVDTVRSKWSDGVKDMRVTSSRQNQVVVCASTDSFVSAWVINLGNEQNVDGHDENHEESHDESHEEENKESTTKMVGGERHTRRDARDSSPREDRHEGHKRQHQQEEGRKSRSLSPSKVSKMEMPKTVPMERTPPRSSKSKQPRDKKDHRHSQHTRRDEYGSRNDSHSTIGTNSTHSSPATITTRLNHSPVTSPSPSPSNSPHRTNASPTSVPLTTSTIESSQSSVTCSAASPFQEESKHAFDAATSMGSSFFGINAPGNQKNNLRHSRDDVVSRRSNSPICLPGSKYNEEVAVVAKDRDQRDETLIKELRQKGKTFRDHMSGRLRELRVISSLWSGSSRSGGRDALSHVQKTYRDDPSIALDFVLSTKLDGGAFDLLSCVTLFPLLSNLLEDFSTEEHMIGLIDAVQTLYRGFGEVICHNAASGGSGGGSGGDGQRKHNPFARDVDIGSEERVHRATACYESLNKIATQISILTKNTTSTQVQRSAKELHRLLSKKGIVGTISTSRR